MNKQISLFKDRALLIVTKHSKEQVLGPIFEKEYNLSYTIPSKFDTDTLGTFSGEIERKDNALDTLRSKCQMALEVEGLDLALATEGSFGNHPTVFFSPANDELIMLYDKKNNVEIVERIVSMETNFDAQEINSFSQLEEFVNKIKFPSHAVIVKNSQHNWTKISKGIQDLETLKTIFFDFTKDQSSCFVETDMRANYNPTRMHIIKEVGLKLVQKINTVCPNCQFPGFGVVRAEAGLLCNQCHLPTRSISAHIYQCNRCEYELKKKYPFKKTTEDPMYCDFCNP
jgi:ribosomal protein L37AE/L43A